MGYTAKFAHTNSYHFASNGNHISYDSSDILFFEPRIEVELDENTTIMGGVPIHMVGDGTKDGINYVPSRMNSDFEFGITRKLDNRTSLSLQAAIAGAQQPTENSLDIHLTLTKQLDGFFN